MKNLLTILMLVLIISFMNAQNNPAPYIGTNLARGEDLLELRLAVSCTAEYTQSVGGKPNASAYITTWLEAINDIYGREYCVRFKLIPNNDDLIFTDANNDPWPAVGEGGPCSTADNALLNAQGTQIDNLIGAANYDISHIFMIYPNGGGGCAGGFKTGISGPPSIPITRHEIGHQFSQPHTISNGGNNNFELSGGNWTIQGGNQQSYAHSSSYHELADHLLTTEANAGTKIPTNNTIPTVSAGADLAIPINTPFVLNGTAYDPDPGDVLTYAWDQLDRGIDQNSPVGDDSQGSLFMRFLPTQSSSRTIPKMSDVIAGNYQTSQENLPTQAREMNIRLTVNDSHRYNHNGTMVNASGVNSDDLKITVVNAGPFMVGAPNNETEVWTAGTNNVAVGWNVANTNIAPVSCAIVDILLSVDGGFTYPYTLAAGVPNNGNAMVNLSSGIPQTSKARVKVECASYENVRFFDISNNDFTVNSTCNSFGGLIIPSNPVSAAPNDNSLNLTLNPIYGQAVSTLPFEVDNSDPTSVFGLYTDATQMGCNNGCCNVNYDLITFTVDQTSTYNLSFLFNNGNEFLAIYDGVFDPNQPCNNFLASNYHDDGLGNYTSHDLALTAGQTYSITVHRVFEPNVTKNGSVGISSSTGGKAILLDATNTPPANAYAYTYVAVDTETKLITSVNANADFRTLDEGFYQVFGLSYRTADPAVNPNTFINQTIDMAQNSPNCAQFSNNHVSVRVEGCTLITVLPVSTSACDVNTNTYSQDLKVIYEFQPGGGNLVINNQSFGITGSPQYVTLNNLTANGQAVNINASFSAEPACSFTQSAVFTAPPSCDFSQTSCNTYLATDGPITISGTGGPTITSTINVPVAGTITDINIKNLNGIHSYISDLTFTLQSPQGTSVTIITSRCGDMDDFNINLDDEAANPISCPYNLGNTHSPDNPLSAFDNENPNGNWTLTIVDGFNEDGGQLNGWTLEICGALAVANCSAVPPVSGTIVAGTYHNSNINTGGIVLAPSTVVVKSGNPMTFGSNFEVQLGATFLAIPEDCNNALANDEVDDRRGLEEEELNVQATAKTLQIHPNPFIDQTTITYQINEATEVSVSVYDMNGRKVTQLVPNHKVEAGNYEVIYQPNQSPYGVYVVVLKTTDMIISKRLVWMR